VSISSWRELIAWQRKRSQQKVLGDEDLSGHHQASTGGVSTSQLETSAGEALTPPGFSRWCFNFTAGTDALLNPSYEIEAPPAKA